jgi:ferredoxin-NADP reductase
MASESENMAQIRKLRCTVRKIVNHGDGVYTLELVPERSLPAYRPGQFLHLALDEYDPSGFWPDSRPFSIANSPTLHPGLRLSYAVKGQFTARMERELVVGCKVWVKLPYGDFVVKNDGPAVLIAGGTGITAFSAFVESLTPEQPHEIKLFYGARSVDLLIYREMVDQMMRSVPRFHSEYFVEVPPAHDIIPSGFQPHLGRMNIEQIWSSLAEPFNQVYYLAGPPAMLAAFSSALQNHRIPPDQIRIDAWE